jgi:hypothetical protein
MDLETGDKTMGFYKEPVFVCLFLFPQAAGQAPFHAELP